MRGGQDLPITKIDPAIPSALNPLEGQVDQTDTKLPRQAFGPEAQVTALRALYKH
jgi:hypothetical protein